MDNCSALLEVLEKDGFKSWEEAIQKVVSYKEKTIVSRYGQLNIKQRYYRERSGKYRFLLGSRR